MHQRGMPYQKYQPRKHNTEAGDEPEHSSDIHIPGFYSFVKGGQAIIQVKTLLDADVSGFAEKVGPETLHYYFTDSGRYADPVDGYTTGLEGFSSPTEVEIFCEPGFGEEGEEACEPAEAGSAAEQEC